ncbi:MAG: cation transporter [Candidatus Atribacteria bacterium]|nr:cation transporter [Candidatus Atribacteria bacterium]
MFNAREQKKRSHRFIKYRKPETEYWANSEEIMDVLHCLPRYFRSLLPELLEKSMSREDMIAYLNQLKLAKGKRVIDDIKKDHLDRDLELAMKKGILEERNGKYELSPAGIEVAEYMQEAIPFFMDQIFSPQIASMATLAIHVILSLIKLIFGIISRSAGLISDGIDNSADTVSSLLVWLGIKFNRERLASVFVIIMMFFSLIGIVAFTYQKLINPGPIKEGMVTFIISALCGLLMLGLSAFQYMAGKKHSNFAIMCQAIDSRNHFYTSLLVCGGIILSHLAETYQKLEFYYADAAASSIIGILILRSAIQLSIELIKPEGEPVSISHFMANAYEKVKKRAISHWLFEQLMESSLTKEELINRFSRQFCEKIPKILILSEMGYRPQNTDDLLPYLNDFIKEKKIFFKDGKYTRKS